MSGSAWPPTTRRFCSATPAPRKSTPSIGRSRTNARLSVMGNPEVMPVIGLVRKLPKTEQVEVRGSLRRRFGLRAGERRHGLRTLPQHSGLRLVETDHSSDVDLITGSDPPQRPCSRRCMPDTAVDWEWRPYCE